MKELLVLILVSLAGFFVIWCVIFGLYFLMIGLLYEMGDVYVILGKGEGKIFYERGEAPFSPALNYVKLIT